MGERYIMIGKFCAREVLFQCEFYTHSQNSKGYVWKKSSGLISMSNTTSQGEWQQQPHTILVSFHEKEILLWVTVDWRSIEIRRKSTPWKECEQGLPGDVIFEGSRPLLKKWRTQPLDYGSSSSSFNLNLKLLALLVGAAAPSNTPQKRGVLDTSWKQRPRVGSVYRWLGSAVVYIW